MLTLLRECIIWSFLGRLIRSILKVEIIFNKSLNDYLAYLEMIWHFDSPDFFKSLYFNFRVCSIKQARICPIYIYGKTRLWSLSGHAFFDDETVKSGLVKWGYVWGYRSNGTTIIRLEGNIYFRGRCLLAQASDIAVFKGATLIVGEDAQILENSLIYCSNSIKIGKNFSFTFQSSMMDTDFHYMLDINQGRIPQKAKPIIIGDNVWVGNRATIKKGVIIPDNTIIAASYSVLTKDYSAIPPYSILGGCPAKLLNSGFSRIWKNEMDNMYLFDKYFDENPDDVFLYINKANQYDYIYECK